MSKDCWNDEELLERMNEVLKKYSDDWESVHSCFDDLFCEVLKQLGYTESVKLFEGTEKWYA